MFTKSKGLSHKRRNVITLVLLLIIAILITFLIKNNYSDIFDYKFYTIELPQDWSIKKVDKYNASLYLKNNNVGSITCNPKCTFNLSITSIISNWIGMHAFMRGNVFEHKLEHYKYEKAYISFEQSAAEQIAGEAQAPSQLHYFFTKDDLLVDLYINRDYVDNITADNIANSIIIK